MTVAKRQPARGNIERLTTIDWTDKSGTVHHDTEIAVLDDGSMLAIVYDRSRPMPAVRANEVDTLHRDPFLRDALAGCRNMEQRQSVLLPLAKQGYDVKDSAATAADPPANYCREHDLLDCWMHGTTEPEPTPEPTPEPVTEPLDFDPRNFATMDDVQQAVATSERHIGQRFDHLAEQIDSLRPTVIQIGGREPVTLPAGDLVHEATAEVIEDMEDGMHVYLTGAPGVGKSRMAATIAKAFGFEPEQTHFFSVSNMDQKNSLLGFVSPLDGKFVPGPLYHAWKEEFTFVDELDAGNGAAMNAANAALDSPYLTFPNGETLKRPERVFILGAGNTTGKGGDMQFMRNQMDSATRNRWVFHHVDYDRNIERQVVLPILGGRTDAWLDHCWGVRDRLESERVVFSTRNILAGAKMIARGRNMQTVVERALLPGESADIVRKSGALAFRG